MRDEDIMLGLPPEEYPLLATYAAANSKQPLSYAPIVEYPEQPKDQWDAHDSANDRHDHRPLPQHWLRDGKANIKTILYYSPTECWERDDYGVQNFLTRGLPPEE